MANLDEQVEAIRAAFQTRMDGAYADEDGQDWREDFASIVEREVKYRNLDKMHSDYLSPFLQSVLRAELATLMSSYYSALHFSHYLEKHSDAVILGIQKRLRELPRPIFLQKDKIRLFLNRLNHVFKAKLARGENVSAAEFMPIPAPEAPKVSVQKQGRGKAKKNRKPKQGRKRPIMGFSSIREAAEKTGESYQYLQKRSLKEAESI